MKRKILPFTCFMITLASCSKRSDIDKNSKVDPATETYLLTEMQTSNFHYKFSYNNEDQLIRIKQDLIDRQNPSFSEFDITYEYEGGKPVKAEVFVSDNFLPFYHYSTQKFNYEGNRIAYTSFTFYSPDQSISRDTSFYEYNAANRVDGVTSASYPEFRHKWKYDQNGNYIEGNKISVNGNTTKEEIFEYQYDNAPNQFSHNNLGQLIYFTSYTNVDLDEMLLSDHSVLQIKQRYKESIRNAQGQVTQTTESIYTRNITPQYDAAGFLSEAHESVSEKYYENNQLIREQDLGGDYFRKFILSKKTP